MSEPVIRLTMEIDGTSYKDILNRLSDLAYRLETRPEVLPVEMVGGSHIVTLRPLADAPQVEWNPKQNGTYVLPEYVCGDCGYKWPRQVIGPPLDRQRCHSCSGLMSQVPFFQPEDCPDCRLYPNRCATHKEGSTDA